jgi:three-Cys-motif partner protein
LNEEEFERRFNGGFVFVCDMGDIFSPGVRDEWVLKVIEHIKGFPSTTFLFLTKNPGRYGEFLDKMPRNAILGATIETDNDELYYEYKMSRAPSPSERIKAMIELPWDRKFVAVEPILDFTPRFPELIIEIKPILVYVGYDNYNNNLPEPPLAKTQELILELKQRGVNVREKTIRYAWYERYKRRSVGIIHMGSDLRTRLEDYERFMDDLYKMNKEALEIYIDLDDVDKQFLRSLSGEQEEHYWTLKKLASLAMYIPMFIQIGRKHFDRLIYVDTHAGPGLARIGNDEREWFLGSPLIALEWPKIVASCNKKFQKIAEGFDKLYFIEKDEKSAAILKKIIERRGEGKKVEVIPKDANIALYTVKRYIESGDRQKTLILMFIDPFGDLESQIRYEVLAKFVKDIKVDIVYNVLSPFIARGLSNLSGKQLEDKLNNLWGPVCTENPHLKICVCVNKNEKCEIGYEDVVYMYELTLNKLEYKTIKAIPVKYSSKIFYHILVASKGDEWLDGYEKYVTTRIRSNDAVLKNLVLRATGRQRALTHYISMENPIEEHL